MSAYEREKVADFARSSSATAARTLVAPGEVLMPTFAIGEHNHDAHLAAEVLVEGCVKCEADIAEAGTTFDAIGDEFEHDTESVPGCPLCAAEDADARAQARYEGVGR